MTDFKNVNTSSQLPQQLAAGARQQNVKPSNTKVAVNESSESNKSGNSLPSTANESSLSSQVSRQQTQQAVAKLTDFVQTIQRDLAFSIDETTGNTIITVKDSKTDEVIRQIPSEDLVKLAQKLKELQETLDDSDSSKGNLLEIRV